MSHTIIFTDALSIFYAINWTTNFILSPVAAIFKIKKFLSDVQSAIWLPLPELPNNELTDSLVKEASSKGLLRNTSLSSLDLFPIVN